MVSMLFVRPDVRVILENAVGEGVGIALFSSIIGKLHDFHNNIK
ncbi:hypothetical protein AB7W12_05010 [Providencia rettgeri]|nr:hypothetical protein BML2526_06050 [Providencia rettgeri]BBV13922.1 hypothetical protein BML2576_33810 [Providencia rettgeri]BDH20025.1 hypothetical protein PrNR1418_33160 [Providencia rettgeri]